MVPRFVLLFVGLIVFAAYHPPEVLAQAGCTYTLGFKALRDQIPDVVGECRESEHFNAGNGNVEQQTTRGLLVWRKVDNWTAFTNGGTTWINGPYGLLSRPNDRQFMWEVYNIPAEFNVDPTALIDPRCCNSDSTAAQPPVTPVPVPPPPPPAPVVNRVGQPVTLSAPSGLSLNITVNSVRDPVKSDNRYNEAKGRWVVVDWTVTNTGSTSWASNPFHFKLQTQDGFVVDGGSQAGLPEPGLSLGTLAPGQTMRGHRAYDVPSGQRLKSAFWQAAGTPQFVIAELGS